VLPSQTRAKKRLPHDPGRDHPACVVLRAR
jgi:hypothetical protein